MMSRVKEVAGEDTGVIEGTSIEGQQEVSCREKMSCISTLLKAIVILYYTCVRFYRWVNWGKGYTGSFCYFLLHVNLQLFQYFKN